jgi:predicted O-methyltransferase YrrM
MTMFGIKTQLKQVLNNFINQGGMVNRFKTKSLMQKFHADECGHKANRTDGDLGYGWIHYGLVRFLKPKNILCIGSRHGFIPAVLAQACKEAGKGHVFFVDAGYGQKDENHWTGVGYWNTREGKLVFDEFGLQNYISLYVLTTSKYQKTTSSRTYDYIYIDGDHSYQGVKKDYQRFWPNLNEGGVMLFHDISVRGKKPEGEYGVWRLWQELENKQKIEFPFLQSGLGFIKK